MPYYIYKIIPGETATARTLEFTGEHDSYREAKNEVKTLRSIQPKDAGLVYKIIFAANQPEAEQLLLEHREKPILKEWEI
jgi:cell division inhibitor SulA